MATKYYIIKDGQASKKTIEEMASELKEYLENDSSIFEEAGTRLNENGTSESYYRVTTTQNLTSPNLRVTLYKRNTDNKDDQTYTEINLNQVFIHSYNLPSTYGLTPGSPNELIVSNGVNPQTDVRMTYQDTLTSGTYRIVFRLYDQDQLIDEDFEYFIIKKEANNVDNP